ncbi:MAG: hypothetical protein L0226_15305 [Acidobacteria bacterium]|nr:hypothetical protein [Acidobacteriota bacterium]
MKRTALFVALMLAIVFAATIVNVNRAAGDDHANHKHQQQPQSQQQEKTPVVDGALTPDAIPDYAAQEIVLRILSSDTPDKIGDRKKAYLRIHGFDEDAQAALMLAAREYKRLVEPIERETDDIKNLNWPNPNSNARAKLKDLQRLKEQHIAGVTSDLNGRLETFRSLDKWTDHISNMVKRKTKGFASELPTKKIGFFRLLPDPFTAYAQAGGCDPTYVYTDALSDGYSMVYGYSSYSAGANNCGHEFYLTTQISHTGAPTASGTDYAIFNLDSGLGYYYDGYFLATTTVEGYCPVAVQTFPAGSNTDDVTVAATVEVKNLTASNVDVAPGDSITLYAEVKATEHATGSVTVGFGIDSNPAPVAVTGANNAVIGGLVNYMVTVSNTVTSSGPKKGPVTFYAGINSAPTGAIASGGQKTVTVCYGPKVMGNCPIQ